MRQPNIKEIQIQLTGFLNKECPAFCKALWNLMLSAQESPRGVPKEMLEAKKLELQAEQVGQHVPLSARLIANTCLQANKAAAESRRRQELEESDMIDSFRRSERSERGDRGGGGNRRGRGDFGGGRRDDRGGRGDYSDRRGGRGDREDRGRDRPFRGDRSERGRDDYDRRPPRRGSASPPPYAQSSPTLQ
jgi:serine/arginine repetitive matrix protein 1